jgi:hypothetical protein
MPARSVSVASSAASAFLRFTLRVWASTTSTVSMLATSPLRTDFGSLFMRSKLNFAASALNSVPSWNLTPRRSLKTRVRGSGCDHDSARLGRMPSEVSSVTSGS